MADEPHIEIRIQSQPRYLCVVRRAVCEAMNKWQLPDHEAHQVMTAVDEAVTNVMRHGYHGRTDRPIWIRLRPVEDGERRGVAIEIEDETGAVDVSKIRARRIDPDQPEPGGLGLHIIRKVMDHVAYTHRPDGRGVLLKMIRYVQPAESAQPNMGQHT